MKELADMFREQVSKEDLLKFWNGRYFKEGIVNLYFKILEKGNLVLLSSFNN